MINANDYYLVCTKTAAANACIDHVDIKNRIFKKTTVSSPAPEYFPGQVTTLEDDGYVKWTVTLTNKVSPAGDKKMAFVVGSMRYREEPQAGEKPLPLNRCGKRLSAETQTHSTTRVSCRPPSVA